MRDSGLFKNAFPALSMVAALAGSAAMTGCPGMDCLGKAKRVRRKEFARRMSVRLSRKLPGYAVVTVEGGTTLRIHFTGLAEQPFRNLALKWKKDRTALKRISELGFEQIVADNGRYRFTLNWRGDYIFGLSGPCPDHAELIKAHGLDKLVKPSEGSVGGIAEARLVED